MTFKTSKATVIFKSFFDNYIKEEADLKNNTFRFNDSFDERFTILDKWIKEKIYGKIKIECKNQPNAHFEREVCDVTQQGRYYIITWKPLNWLSKEELEKDYKNQGLRSLGNQ